MNRTDRNITAFAVGALLITFSVLAFAGGTKEPPPPVTLEQEQLQSQTMMQDQSQAQDQRQDQSQTQSIGDQSNSQSMTVATESQAHSAVAPSVFATAPCYVGGSAAIGLKGVNIGGGRVKVDPECELRETARLLGSLQERELAVMVVCKTKAAIAAIGDLCKPNASKSKRIKELEDRIRLMLTEREIDREVCDNSIERCEANFKK